MVIYFQVFQTQFKKENYDMNKKSKSYQDSTVVANDKNVVVSNGEIVQVDVDHTTKEPTYKPGKIISC